jgi:DNA-binding CsgD family transcriptional regulator
MASRVSSPIFVGRQFELDRVATALAEARLDNSRVLLVGGEAGVGKTRFVREAERMAVDADVRVLEGGCLPLGGEGLPFGAVIEALRSLTQTVDRLELEAMAGSGRTELARLMPELEPAPEAVHAGPDGFGQGRLFEHLLRFLMQLGQLGPLALVLEDIHWADRSTLELIGFLARNLRSMPVVLLATFRTDELHRRHPLPLLLAELDRSGHVERLTLARFDRDELAGQLQGILGARPEPAVLSRIAARSEGNAFHAEELLAAGSLNGELPATLRDVLLARLAVLSEPTQELLRVASAAGHRIESARLAAVTGLSEMRLDEQLRDAVANQILVVADPPAQARLTFRHALVQEAVYSELLPGERARLHAAFARAISAEGPDTDASSAAELAYHWQAAQDLPRAFDAWIKAGLAAEAIYASAEVREDFEHALELWDRVPDAAARAPLDRVELLTRAAFHAEGPEPSRSVDYIREAIALVDSTADPTRAGLLHERLGQYCKKALDVATSEAAYREAVRLVPAEPPSAARSWVLSGLGRFLAGIERPVEAVAVCEEALSVARAAGAREVEARALVPLGMSRVMVGDVEAGLATMRRAREVAAGLGDVHGVAWASTWLSSALCDAGRYSEAATAGLEAEAYAVRHGLGARWAPDALIAVAEALFQIGRWDDAAEALTRAQRHELHGQFELQVAAQLLLMESGRGQFESANRRAPRVLVLAERFATGWTAALAELALWQDDPLAARAAVAGAIAHPDTPARDRGWAFASGITAEADIAALARSAHDEVGLVEARTRGAVLLEQMQGVFEDVSTRMPYFRPWVAAQLASCEAEFSRLEGTPDPDRWAAAADAWQALQIPYEAGYALMREAEATLAQHGDRPRAARSLKAAHAIATRLGAAPLLRRTEQLAARAGITLEPADGAGIPEGGDAVQLEAGGSARLPGGRHDLTRRELEVLALIGAGRSNGEIGELLYVSKKTVSVHVANIKAKLGASGRVEIAVYAIQLGLVEGRRLLHAAAIDDTTTLPRTSPVSGEGHRI